MSNGGSNTRILLDLLDGLLHLDPRERAHRIAEIGVSEGDRAQLESWLRLHDGEESSLQTPPAFVLDAMRLLAGQPGDSSAGGSANSAALESVNLSPAPPPQIPGYDVSEPLGRGGMATVWRAVQRGTGRAVALKVLDPLLLNSPRARSRFERELRLMGKLRHPHIARVYDGGISAGVCYCAMELIDGLPLDEYVKAGTLPRDRILELMTRVCQAVAHAHQNGVIHRDLKPSNILVDKTGAPHVLDFGLARALEEAASDPNTTFDGQLAGTPAYMSPEQAAGKTTDTRTDVYSLGVIL